MFNGAVRGAWVQDNTTRSLAATSTSAAAVVDGFALLLQFDITLFDSLFPFSSPLASSLHRLIKEQLIVQRPQNAMRHFFFSPAVFFCQLS